MFHPSAICDRRGGVTELSDRVASTLGRSACSVTQAQHVELDVKRSGVGHLAPSSSVSDMTRQGLHGHVRKGPCRHVV